VAFQAHNHAPQQLAIGLALHQQAADQVGGNLLGGADEEEWGEVLGRSWWLWGWLGWVAPLILLTT